LKYSHTLHSVFNLSKHIFGALTTFWNGYRLEKLGIQADG